MRKRKVKEVEDGEVHDAKSLLSTKTGSVDKTAAAPPSGPSAVSTNAPSAASDEQAQNYPLAMRQEVPQGNLPKAPLPNQLQTGPPPRPDFSRSFPERGPSNLPNRPEMPITGRVHPDRHLPGRVGDRRDMHQTRTDRPIDNARWSRDNMGQDRRGLDMNTRNPERPLDRQPFDRDGHKDRHDTVRRGPEFFPGDRERNRPGLDPRGSEMNGRPSREESMLPARPGSAQADHGAPFKPEHLALVDPAINPARAALISSGSEPLRTGSPRGFRDDRNHPRPQSPRRGDRLGGPDSDPMDVRRGERVPTGRDSVPEIQDQGRMRHDDNQGLSFPPRGVDRPTDRSTDRSRDVFQPSHPLSRSVDPDHGRLNQANRHGESNFGRLNSGPPPVHDIPSGPRSHGQRGSNWQASGNAPRIDGRQQGGPPRPPSPDMLPPTGPAVDRSLRGPDSSLSGTGTPPISGNAATPIASTHLERQRHLPPDVHTKTTQVAPAVPAPPVSVVPEGIHPSRLRGFQDDIPATRSPAPLQTSNVRQTPAAPSPQYSGPPAGPRGQAMQPPMPSQSMQPATPTLGGSNVPTGPSFAPSDRVRGPMRQLAGINSTLQQAGQSDRFKAPDRSSDRSINVRGRGSVASAPDGPNFPNSGPSTPVNATRPDTRDSGRGRDMGAPEQSPGDLFSSRANKDPEEDRSESRPGSTRDSGRHERSGRRSRRTSRSPDRERSHREHGSVTESRTEMGGRSGPEFREIRGVARRDSERDMNRRVSGRSLPSTPGEGGRERDSSRREGRDAEKVRDGPPMRGPEPDFNRGPPYQPQQHMSSGRGDGLDRTRGTRSSRGSEDRRDGRDGRSSRDDGTGSIGKRRGEDRGPDRGRDKRARQS